MPSSFERKIKVTRIVVSKHLWALCFTMHLAGSEASCLGKLKENEGVRNDNEIQQNLSGIDFWNREVGSCWPGLRWDAYRSGICKACEGHWV